MKNPKFWYPEEQHKRDLLFKTGKMNTCNQKRCENVGSLSLIKRNAMLIFFKPVNFFIIYDRFKIQSNYQWTNQILKIIEYANRKKKINKNYWKNLTMYNFQNFNLWLSLGRKFAKFSEKLCFLINENIFEKTLKNVSGKLKIHGENLKILKMRSNKSGKLQSRITNVTLTFRCFFRCWRSIKKFFFKKTSIWTVLALGL
jgi:hypothetical protein